MASWFILTPCIKFEGQGDRSKSTATGGKC